MKYLNADRAPKDVDLPPDRSCESELDVMNSLTITIVPKVFSIVTPGIGQMHLIAIRINLLQLRSNNHMNRGILLVRILLMAFLVSQCPKFKPAGKQYPANRAHPIAAVGIDGLGVFTPAPAFMSCPPVATPPSAIKVDPSNSILMLDQVMIYGGVVLNR